MFAFFLQNRFRPYRAVLVSLLVLALIFATTPLPFFGANTAQAAAEKKPVELVEKRTATSKTFANGDGTFTTKIYSTPVHFQENGLWREIDSSIKKGADGSYENAAAPFKARFGVRGRSGDLFSFASDGVKVSFTLAEDGVSDVAPVVEENKITYENILPETDLRFVVTDIGVKEDIILKKYTGKNTFTFSLKLAGVVAVKEEDGSIAFYRHGQNREKVFFIPKPFMVDSNIDPQKGEGERCDNVTADVEQKGANIYITITADEAWLKSPDRVYPVYIDPTTTLSQSGDAYVSSAYPNTNYNVDWNSAGYYQLKCGYYDSTTGTCYSYLRFDLTPIYGKLITAATFNIYTAHSYYTTTPTGVWLNVVDTPWDPATITYNTRPSNSYYANGYTTAVKGTWASFNVTDLLGNWVSDPPRRANYGVVIHENGNGTTYWKKFYASENSTNKPYLSVTYSDPPAAPTGTAYGNSVNTSSGYVNLTWNPVPGATGYKVMIFNGYDYEAFDVGNVTSWSSKGKNIWPTPAEIAAGRYALHHDGLGTELADNPSLVYRNAKGGYNADGRYNNAQNYWFRIKAYNAYGETVFSREFTPYIPDRTAPPAVSSVAVSGSNGPFGSGSSATVTATWTGVNDPVTGSNSGTSFYRVYLYKTDLKTGATSSQYVDVPHTGTVTHTYTFTNQPDSTQYRVAVRTFDKNGNYSGFTYSGYWSSADRTNPTVSLSSPANGATVTGQVTVKATAADDVALSKVNLTLRKVGTGETWNLGDRTGTSPAWTWDTAVFTDGEYTLTATAYDNQGNTATTQINVKVENIPSGMGEGPWGTVENRCGKVNLVSGNFTVAQTDIQLPGRGLGTTVTRIYNSQATNSGPLGWGWRLGVPELAQYSDGSVVITDGDGSKHRYTKKADGSYQRPAGIFRTLTRNSDGTFTWRDKDGSYYTFDLAGRAARLTDKNGNSVTYTYNSAGQLTTITDPTGRKTTFTYDSTTGRLTAVTDYGNRRWTYTYDGQGHLVKVTDPLNHTVTFTYDSAHRLIGITDARGYTTAYTYTAGKLTVETDPLNHTTTYAYDSPNKKFTVTDPKGNVTSYAYDGNGNITAVTDAQGNTTTYQYDSDFNLIKKTDPLGRTTTYTYDTNGNLLTETDPGGHTTTCTYDQNNNLIKKTDPAGQTITYTYDSRGNLISDGSNTYTYKPDGTVASVTDASGNTTTYSYDLNGNLIAVTDATGKTTTYTYNILGQKLSETDPAGNTTTYTYDLLGHLLAVTVPGENGTPNTTTYTYDANGNRLTATDPSGNTTSWEYDPLNRVTKITEPGNKIRTVTYDEVGNTVSETAPDSRETTYTYDALNRLIRVNYPDGKTVTYTYDAAGQKTAMTDATGTTTYEYDPCGNLIRENFPGGKTTTYTYDGNHRLTAKTVSGRTTTYTYDGQNNLTSLTDLNGFTTTFAYDASKNRTAISYPNSTKITYTYDPAGKITAVKNLDPAGNSLFTFDYTYYDNGLIKTVTTSRGTTTYEYDGQNRLTKITYPDGKITEYTYDAAGNRVAVANREGNVTLTTTYTYDSANQLTAITNPDGTTVTFTYDANGNLIARTGPEGTTTYEYNPENQLTRVVKPDGDVIEFAYDGSGRRVSKAVNGSVIKYEYDGDLIAAETDLSGNILAAYTYDDKGVPISVTKGGQTYYYMYNGHGDVVALTDAGGNVVSTYDYDVWGNVTAQAGTLDTPFGYAGQYGYVFDKETGLYFLKSRYYDPETGRFTTRDRFKGFENRPASQNAYTYTENDPVNKVDPEGYWSIWTFLNRLGGALVTWIFNLIFQGIIMYFWTRPSQLDWGLWWVQVIITGKAALIAWASSGQPWAGTIAGIIAGAVSYLFATIVRSYAYNIKRRNTSVGTLAYWATLRARRYYLGW